MPVVSFYAKGKKVTFKTKSKKTKSKKTTKLTLRKKCLKKTGFRWVKKGSDGRKGYCRKIGKKKKKACCDNCENGKECRG